MNEDFKGIPIEDLIAAPLLGASHAQKKLASDTLEFIEEVSKKEDKVFRYNDNGRDVTFSAPTLALVNVPNLSVKEASVDFSMEVKTQSVDKKEIDTSIETNVSASAGALFYKAKVNISGHVATKSTNTRQTDKSAKYDVHVLAKDNGIPEGLSRVLDIMNNGITNPNNIIGHPIDEE